METSFLRRQRRKIFLPLFNLFFSRKTRLWECKRVLLKAANVDVAATAKVVGPLTLGAAANLTIGDGVWLGTDFSVYGSGTCIIGNNCDIGPNVSILSGSHEIGDSNRRAGAGIHYIVQIGSGTWVGGRSTVYGNTCIGSGCIVAAGAVVNSSVEDNTMIGGVPAKVLRRLEVN